MIRIEELYDIYRQHPVISTDSRNIPQGCLFFALKGDQFNGNAFALQALEKGAAYAIVDEDVPGDRCLRTTNALETLQELARHHRRQLNIPFLAITGSNGKTTTKELVHAVLSSSMETYATRGNLNNHIGVPLTVLSITSRHRFAVIEMGANHQREIEFLCSIAMPGYGLITNVGKAHLEGFGGFEGVKKGKGELYEFLAGNDGTVFINDDNDHLRSMCDKSGIQKRIRYGISPGADCCGEITRDSPFLALHWRYKNQEGTAQTQLSGSYNFENALAAACVGHHFGVETQKIVAALEGYVPSNSRSQQVQKGSNRIILDAYNANPTSMSAALKNFSTIDAPYKILFLGEMSELGDESVAEHQGIADIIESMKVDEVVLVGKKFRDVHIRRTCRHFDNSDQAAAFAKEKKYSDSLLLIKGSRSTKMEKVFEAL